MDASAELIGGGGGTGMSQLRVQARNQAREKGEKERALTVRTGASSGRCRGGRRGADGDESGDDAAVAEGGEELDPDGAAELRSRWFA